MGLIDIIKFLKFMDSRPMLPWFYGKCRDNSVMI